MFVSLSSDNLVPDISTATTSTIFQWSCFSFPPSFQLLYIIWELGVLENTLVHLKLRIWFFPSRWCRRVFWKAAITVSGPGQYWIPGTQLNSAGGVGCRSSPGPCCPRLCSLHQLPACPAEWGWSCSVPVAVCDCHVAGNVHQWLMSGFRNVSSNGNVCGSCWNHCIPTNPAPNISVSLQVFVWEAAVGKAECMPTWNYLWTMLALHELFRHLWTIT